MSEKVCIYCGGEPHRIYNCPGPLESRLREEAWAEFEHLLRDFEFGTKAWFAESIKKVSGVRKPTDTQLGKPR